MRRVVLVAPEERHRRVRRSAPPAASASRLRGRARTLLGGVGPVLDAHLLAEAAGWASGPCRRRRTRPAAPASGWRRTPRRRGARGPCPPASPSRRDADADHDDVGLERACRRSAGRARPGRRPRWPRRRRRGERRRRGRGGARAIAAPIAGPSARTSGDGQRLEQRDLAAELRAVAATSGPMKPAPTTTTRGGPPPRRAPERERVVERAQHDDAGQLGWPGQPAGRGTGGEDQRRRSATVSAVGQSTRRSARSSPTARAPRRRSTSSDACSSGLRSAMRSGSHSPASSLLRQRRAVVGQVGLGADDGEPPRSRRCATSRRRAGRRARHRRRRTHHASMASPCHVPAGSAVGEDRHHTCSTTNKNIARAASTAPAATMTSIMAVLLWLVQYPVFPGSTPIRLLWRDGSARFVTIARDAMWPGRAPLGARPHGSAPSGRSAAVAEHQAEPRPRPRRPWARRAPSRAGSGRPSRTDRRLPAEPSAGATAALGAQTERAGLAEARRWPRRDRPRCARSGRCARPRCRARPGRGWRRGSRTGAGTVPRARSRRRRARHREVTGLVDRPPRRESGLVEPLAPHGDLPLAPLDALDLSRASRASAPCSQCRRQRRPRTRRRARDAATPERAGVDAGRPAGEQRSLPAQVRLALQHALTCRTPVRSCPAFVRSRACQDPPVAYVVPVADPADPRLAGLRRPERRRPPAQIEAPAGTSTGLFIAEVHDRDPHGCWPRPIAPFRR